MKAILSIICLCLLSISSWAQAQKYWVFFTDKPESAYDYRAHLSAKAIENRTLLGIPLHQYSDIPLNPKYVSTLREKGITTEIPSKWFNAITAVLSAEQKSWVLDQDFVEKVVPMKSFLIPARKKPLYSDRLELGTAISQMSAETMLEEGLDGSDVVIGIIDAGFYGAQEDRFLKDVFKEGRVLGIRDLVNPTKEDHYGMMETYSDDHGTTVMKMVTGKKGKTIQSGFATNAQFYLARTDHGNNESRQEEAHWIRAMEWMDSLGVRIINTSLGYALGFDNPEENHKPTEMDGETTMITQAAQKASDEKGILLIVSAGNEGNDMRWQVVSAPADAKGVISVGATDPRGLKMGYSSIGPEELTYLKPDVSCYSLGGTSFSAPVITGFAACLMQKNPTATNEDLLRVIRESGSLYPYGNNFIGYGIPSSELALRLLDGESVERTRREIQAEGQKSVTVKSKAKSGEEGLVFHKSSEKNVLKQKYLKGGKGKFEIKQPEGATRSTVVIGDEVIEVFW